MLSEFLTHILNTIFAKVDKRDEKIFEKYIWNQGSFISEIVWAPFKCILWNANDSIIKLMVSITRNISLWFRPWKQQKQMTKIYGNK